MPSKVMTAASGPARERVRASEQRAMLRELRRAGHSVVMRACSDMRRHALAMLCCALFCTAQGNSWPWGPFPRLVSTSQTLSYRHTSKWQDTC